MSSCPPPGLANAYTRVDVVAIGKLTDFAMAKIINEIE